MPQRQRSLGFWQPLVVIVCVCFCSVVSVLVHCDCEVKLRFVCFNFLIGCQRRVRARMVPLVWQSRGDGVVDNGGDAGKVFRGFHSFIHKQYRSSL